MGTLLVIGVVVVIWVMAVILFCAGVAATIAQSKGHDPYPWMLMGLLFGPLAILAIGFLPENSELEMPKMIDVSKGRYYPEMPPPLADETPEQYTNRLTGADGTDRKPYDHVRNRQCSIGYHEECTDPFGERCKCPCHCETTQSLP